MYIYALAVLTAHPIIVVNVPMRAFLVRSISRQSVHQQITLSHV